MGDGIRFKREILGSRFVIKDISTRFKKLEVQFYDRNLDHLMDNFTLRPLVNSSKVPGVELFNRNTFMQKYRGRSARMAASFDLTSTTQGIIGYEHKDEKFGGNNQTDTLTCISSGCFSSFAANPFYDLSTINNSIFTEVTHFVNDSTTIKAGLRRDYFHTLSGELRDFQGTTIFPTSNSRRDDIANSGFIRVEKEVMPGAVAFVSVANGERPASNLERASFNGFNLKKEKNRELNIGLTISRPTWQGSVTVFGSRINDYILISQGTRSENIDVDRVGTEFDLITQITPNWKLFGNLAWIRAENLTGHGNGPVPLGQTPPLDSRYGVIFQQGTLVVTLGGRSVMRQSRIDPGFGNSLGIDNPDPTPGFTTANMSLSMKPIKQIQLSMGIDNVFNLTYYEHLSRRIGDVPTGFVNFGHLNEPGRVVWFRAVYNM
jgi:iron complex outermembrane receptor protein